MEDKINSVVLTQPVMSYVEKCYYEWKCYLAILNYICRNDDVKDYVDYYTDLCTNKYVELEYAKKEALNIALGIKAKNVSEYEFDFDTCTLNYKEIDR